MNEITCDVCMDLIPLVQDGVASQDSVLAVENHIKNCFCKHIYAYGNYIISACCVISFHNYPP